MLKKSKLAPALRPRLPEITQFCPGAASVGAGLRSFRSVERALCGQKVFE